LEYVGPLVDTHVQEKPLSIAMREISADLLTYERVEGDLDENGVQSGGGAKGS
jgi:DNA-directed RNA polymerase subunit omega